MDLYSRRIGDTRTIVLRHDGWWYCYDTGQQSVRWNYATIDEMALASQRHALLAACKEAIQAGRDGDVKAIARILQAAIAQADQPVSSRGD